MLPLNPVISNGKWSLGSASSDRAAEVSPSRRPILIAIGHSFVAQDSPTIDAFYSATSGNVTVGGSTNAGVTAVSHLLYFNALTLCTFDYLLCDIPAAQITPLSTSKFTNGIYGASGQTLINVIDTACDVLFRRTLVLADGAPVFCLFDPWINDLNANDVAGYWQAIWRTWLRIQSKAIDAGITPILHSPSPSTYINTPNKSANWYKVRDLVLSEGIKNTDIIAVNTSDLYRNTAQASGYPWPLGYASDAEAVALTGHANGKVYSLFNRHADAAGGNGLHRNARGQALCAIATRDAVKASGKLIFAPPTNVSHLSLMNLAENSTFEATTGTAVAGGTNVAAGASTTHRGWQRNAFGANSQINVTDVVDTLGKIEPLVSIYPTSSAAVSDHAGLTSTLQASTLLVPGVSVLRYFEHVTVHKALNISSMERQIRVTGGSFAGVGAGTGGGSAPSDLPPDNQLGWRNAPGLLEGQELVWSSFPFYCDPTPNNTIRNIGGSLLQSSAPFTSIGAPGNSGSEQTVHYAGLQIVG
ncbi:hypothetical protein [Methylomonas sp. 11b]|uniref:hypothetical protein n=1 Tax=Methylomonas sp. 11b TaxID=1168169 RepID=UPI0004793E3D|nr:hypothetical protein [Methylomonas sp. 11b]